MNAYSIQAANSVHSARHPLQHPSAVLEELLGRERWSRDRLVDYQQHALRVTLQHAVSASPYYRDLMAGEGVAHAGDVRLEDFPPLTKQALMSEWDRIVTDPDLRLADAERHIAGQHAGELLSGKYQVVASGGTSGAQGVAVYDPSAWATAIAAFQRAMAMQGITPQMRAIGIGSPSPLHMTYRLFASMRAEQPRVPRISLTTPLPEVVAVLNAYQPEVITTYPSFVRRLAEEQQSGRLRILPRTFVSTAETLTPDVREVARNTWGAVVLNAYGATEVNLIGAECPLAAGAHVPEDLIVLEVVDELNRPVPSGTVGSKILVTTLNNRTFPLIRYEIGDLLSVVQEPCACGRPHMRIQSLRGRREDFLRLSARDGGYVSVHAIHLHALLVHVPEIRQFEFAHGPDALRIRIALKSPEASTDLLSGIGVALQRELARLGADTRVVIELANEIARTGTGAKQKLVRNESSTAAPVAVF